MKLIPEQVRLGAALTQLSEGAFQELYGVSKAHVHKLANELENCIDEHENSGMEFDEAHAVKLMKELHQIANRVPEFGT